MLCAFQKKIHLAKLECLLIFKVLHPYGLHYVPLLDIKSPELDYGCDRFFLYESAVVTFLLMAGLTKSTR
jgi:hypothetical protein